jgi:hypothetical protein
MPVSITVTLNKAGAINLRTEHTLGPVIRNGLCVGWPLAQMISESCPECIV